MFLYLVSFTVNLTSNLQFPATSRLPSLSAEGVTEARSRINPGEQHHPHAVMQFVRQTLSLSRSEASHEPPVVEIAADRKFTVRGSSFLFVPFLLINVTQRLAAANLPEYRKVDDTRVRLLPYRREWQKMTHRMTHLTMIRSQMCIGARRSSATARAGLMAH